MNEVLSYGYSHNFLSLICVAMASRGKWVIVTFTQNADFTFVEPLEVIELDQKNQPRKDATETEVVRYSILSSTCVAIIPMNCQLLTF